MSQQLEIRPAAYPLTGPAGLSINRQTGRPDALAWSLRALLLVILVGGIGLVGLAVWGDRPRSHLRLEVAWLGPALLGLIALELVQAELWRRLLRALGGSLEVLPAFAVWCVSAIARYVPSSMLMPVLRVHMSRRRGVPADVGLASVLYEGVLTTCGALFVAAYVVVALPALRGDMWRWCVLVLPFAAVCVMQPKLFAILSTRLLRRLRRPPLPSLLSVRQLLGFSAGYTASFVLGGFSFAAVVLTLHPVTLPMVPIVIGAMAFGFLASAFAFLVPGGLGAREAALVIALSPLMSAVTATAAAVALRLMQLGVESSLALLLAWLAHRRDARQTRSPDPMQRL